MSVAASAITSLTARELLRVVRQPVRIAAALLTALLFWLFLAAGLADAVTLPGAPEGVSYGSFLVPGMATLVVTFSSIFSAISLIEDRAAGLLQAALISPAPRWSVLGAKALGATLVAAAQGAVVLSASLVLPSPPGAYALLLAILALTLTAAAVSCLSLAFAWWIDSTAGFHSVMNLVLMPMWLLSGAIFPAAGAHPALALAMRLDPLAWSTGAIRAALLERRADGPLLLLTLLFAVGAAAAALLASSRAPRR